MVHNLKERFGALELQVQGGGDPFSHVLLLHPFLRHRPHPPVMCHPFHPFTPPFKDPPKSPMLIASSLNNIPLNFWHPSFYLTSGPTQLRQPCYPYSDSAHSSPHRSFHLLPTPPSPTPTYPSRPDSHCTPFVKPAVITIVHTDVSPFVDLDQVLVP